MKQTNSTIMGLGSLRKIWLFGLVTAFFLFFTPFASQGQTKEEKKIQKLLEKATGYLNANELVTAEEYYQEVLEIDPDNYEATYRMAYCNYNLDDYREGLRWIRKTIELDPSRNDTLYVIAGLLYKRLGNYRKGREAIQEFMQRHPHQGDLYERALRELKGCDLAEASMSQPPPYDVKHLDFNSFAADQFPAFLDQRQEDVYLVYTSHRPVKKVKGKLEPTTGQPSHSDLFYVVRENDSTFGEVQVMDKRLQAKTNHGSATFSSDGLTVYMTICDSKKNKQGCSIFESRYDPVKKSWSKLQFVEALSGKKEVIVNSRGKTKQVPTDDRQPWLSRDGRTLAFVSDRGGGEGGFDIWYSRRVGAGWSEPVNAGPNINTAFDEISPYLNEDNSKLFFASNGLGGFGGFDIYEAPGDIGAWGEPVNVGYPVNTNHDDFASIWLENDSLVYFTTEREGGAGDDDIYMARKVYRAPPKLDIAVKGLIRDKDTKQPIEFATAILYKYQEDGSITALDTFETDQSARYEFPLDRDTDYKVLGNAPEYLANEEEVSTKDITESTELVRNIDIELEPIVIGKPIVLQNIYYDFDEFYIREDAVAELNNLIKVLNDNPNIIIQMGAHTDSNGSEPYNKELSNNRARSVVRYLADNGVDPSRLSWFGFGESQPLIFPEMSDEDEQINRRTEFRITSIEFNQPQ